MGNSYGSSDVLTEQLPSTTKSILKFLINYSLTLNGTPIITSSTYLIANKFNTLSYKFKIG